MTKVKLDINNPELQLEWFNLEKTELLAFNRTLKRLITFNWEQLYTIKGLHWEQIYSRKTKNGYNLYSFRFSQKYRATAYRDNEYLVILNLHTDHDSAYE